MNIDKGTVQKFWVIMTIIIELYKIGMGTFLIFFVPQRCDDHVCQIQELTPSTDIYPRIAIYMNSFTLLTILFTYIWEWRREKWFMKHLDSVASLPYDNLCHIAQDSRSIERNLFFYNLHYLRALRVTATTCLINFLMSGYVIYHRYMDYTTPISYFSFALLLLEKLKKSYFVGKKSQNNKLALSAYKIEPVSFNATNHNLYFDVPVGEDGNGLSFNYTPPIFLNRLNYIIRIFVGSAMIANIDRFLYIG